MNNALRAPLAVLRQALCLVVLLPATACFGTGVSTATQAQGASAQSRVAANPLIVADTTLTPPAPALGEVTWTNIGDAPLTLLRIAVDDSAKTTFTAPQCEGFPTLEPNGRCRVQLTAATDATPGSYPVTVAYSANGNVAETSFVLTLAPGTLRINNGAPLALDAYTTQTPITVTNEGFDLRTLNLQAQCPAAASQTSTCTLDPNSCSLGLKANSSCTALLNVTDGAGGQAGAVTAGGGNTGAVGCGVAISVANLTVVNLSVSAPGNHVLTVTNGGQAPLSVLDVTITAAQAAGLHVALPVTGCQAFVGTCGINVAVGPEAQLTDGLGVVTVTYTDGLATHVAQGVMVLDNLTAVQVQPVPTAVNTGADNVAVSAINLGPWVWHRAGLSLAPALRGAALHSTCSTEIDVGQSYTATLTATAPAEATSRALTAQGSNLASPQSTPVTVGRSIVLVGRDASNKGSVTFSTDGGATWTTPSTLPATDGLNHALLTDDVWVAVGNSLGAPAIVQSYDRGATWQLANVPAVGHGDLAVVATDGSQWVAFGDDGQGGPLCLRNTHGGLTWSQDTCGLNTLPIGAVRSAASNGTAWTLVGDANDDYYIISSSDGMATWGAPVTGSGQALGVTWTGLHWIVVGTLTDGVNPQKSLVAHNVSPQALGPSWVLDDTTTLGTGGLVGVTSSGGPWLAYGSSGSNAIVVTGTFAPATALTATVVGRGEIVNGALHNTDRLVGYVNTNTFDTEIDVSTDGTTFTQALPVANGSVTAIISR